MSNFDRLMLIIFISAASLLLIIRGLGQNNLTREVAVNRDRIAQLEGANPATTDTITIEPGNGHMMLIEEYSGPDEEL